MNAYVYCHTIGLNGEKQCFQTIKTKMKEVNRKIYILFNSRYRRMKLNEQKFGYIELNGLRFGVTTYV